jgi:NAD(P)-dependent dehydrogenase (short-subunit alcohol dehydrogenase family)
MQREAFSMVRDLQGKVAIVTGAARGIGLCIAKELADRGAVIASADITPFEEWKNSLSNPHSSHFVDITSNESCLSLVESVLRSHGEIDLLVNNAGIVRRGPAHLMSESDFTTVVDVNLNGTFRMCRAAYSALKQNSGSIVNIGSTSGQTAVKNSVGYSVSKASVMFMSKVLAYEWAADGIRVNAVGPTIVPSDMTASLFIDEQYMSEKLASIPLGRVASQEDVAKMVAFLLSDDAKMITGQVVFIDGGVTIH